MGNSTIVDLAATGSGGNVNPSLTEGLDIDVTPVSDLLQVQGEERLDGSSSTSLPFALDEIDYWDFEVLRANNIIYNMNTKTDYTLSAFISGSYTFATLKNTITIRNKLTNSLVKSVTVPEPSASAYSNLWHIGTIIDYEETTDTLYLPVYYVDSYDNGNTVLYKCTNFVKGTPSYTAIYSIERAGGSVSESTIISYNAIYGINNTHTHLILLSPGATSSTQTYSYISYNTTADIENATVIYSKQNGPLGANLLTINSLTTSTYGLSIIAGESINSRYVISSFVSGYGKALYGDSNTAIVPCSYRSNVSYCIIRVNTRIPGRSTVELLCNTADIDVKLGTFKRIDNKVYTLLHNSRYAQIVQVNRIGSLTF